MPAMRPCPTVGCPTLVSKGHRYCPACTRTRDADRGTRQARGYDAAYDRTRKAWLLRIAKGGVRCWRCDQPITNGAPWHLGHDDDRRIVGPECARCNLSAAGRARHQT